ncbi:hypothetical protein ACFVH6_30385 [Spirillospora sp. NPDC127200]
MRYYVGAPKASWLFGTYRDRRIESIDFPLFISHRTLKTIKTLKPAITDWAQDSSGFTMLQKEGCWTFTPAQYIADCRRFTSEIGRVQRIAPMDYMCEPPVIQGGRWGREYFVGTKLSVPEHQQLTVNNYCDLRALAPDLEIFPVVQGWQIDDYKRCIDLYSKAGIDLTQQPLVGVGSVCRRPPAQAAAILTMLVSLGLTRLHGFGVKLQGIEMLLRALAAMQLLDAFLEGSSFDSMAWSVQGKNTVPAPDCTGHKNEANCLPYAHAWNQRLNTRFTTLITQLRTQPVQLALGDAHSMPTAA